MNKNDSNPDKEFTFAIRLVQQLVVPTFVLDKDCKVIIWNHACERLTGVLASEVMGTSEHWKAFYSEQRLCLADVIVKGREAELPALYTHFDTSSDSELGIKAENWCVMPHLGSLLYLVIDASSISDEKGQLLAVVETLRDITARKKAEDALLVEKTEQIALIKKLEEAQNHLLQSDKMASIGQLAAGVAHEINNPIGYVYSNLSSLEKYIKDTFSMLNLYEQAENSITDTAVRAKINATKKTLDIAFLKEDLHALIGESREGITRVKEIVQNLKDFSHIDVSDEWHFANLHKGLDSTLNIVNNEIKYKATLIKEYGDIPDVECLSSQINQVFMNLVVNAAHAIEERGTIKICTGQQGDEVWVSVTDTGKGIPPEHMKKIFDPFFTTKPIGQGTGLGLSMSYSIIRKHHGRIEVQSELGKGSTFRIWLPIKQVHNVH